MLSLRCLPALASLLTFVAAAPASSAPASSKEEEKELGRKVRDPERYRTDQHGAVELRIGPYRPRIDQEFAGAATPFQDIFGTSPSISVGLEGDWQALRIPHFGSLGPGVGFSYVQYTAYALRETNPSERSAQPTRLWMLPAFAVAVLRLDVFARDFSIPLVPYAKAGLALTLWEAKDAGRVSEEDNVGAQGIETGVQAMLGGMLLLDFFAPQAAIDMDNSTGVNHAYLFGEWMVSDVASFESGLQTGVNTWQVGLTLEF